MPLRSEERDPALLWELRKALRRVDALTSSLDEKQFVEDATIVDATAMNLLAAGEALNKLTFEAVAQFDLEKVRALVEFRHALAHGYFRVHPSGVWRMVVENATPIGAVVDQLPLAD
jgi:uncharacterized protein with HEPN domain